jgi:hypothetical protein
MAGFSDEYENEVLSAVFKQASVGLTTLYISLHSVDPADLGGDELSGNGYTREQLDTDATEAAGNWSAVAGGSVTNNADITFGPASGGDWGYITYFGLWDHATLAGATRFVGSGTITGGVTISDTQSLVFSTGNLSFSLD